MGTQWLAKKNHVIYILVEAVEKVRMSSCDHSIDYCNSTITLLNSLEVCIEQCTLNMSWRHAKTHYLLRRTAQCMTSTSEVSFFG
ncbi:hypothetical protein IMCC3135_33705 [Granulosicoccus antarcticus IMCC3135]|uniref:Uncharacterized protein n=1 Tax=Granulosicoccus antarcticus IMCC3135 TaxID=1192854 RepID=A0A2Z2NZ94_9GAMM|nr:hypothetical protein IMCC3135_33705 [Granulosicoccus antarcticus IMCC3135]